MFTTIATKILRERIVLIFDFDDTLDPNTTRAYFEHLGLPFEEFKSRLRERKDRKW